MSKTDVQEMVNLCKGLGLRVAFETGGAHYTVRDPSSDAKLFYISSTPSDSNFKYEIARHLRRLGLLKGNLKFGKFKTVTRKKKYGPIDLVALKKAQQQAESAGERIPLLEDIEGDHTFFRRYRLGNVSVYTNEAQQEAIDNMTMKLTPRGSATKARLRKTLEEKEMSHSKFVRIAMAEGDRRGLRVWPSLNAGQAAIGKFANEDNKTLQLWGINLIEATLDHIDGLKFDTEPTLDEERNPVVELVHGEYITEETLLNILDNFRVQIENKVEDIVVNASNSIPITTNGLRDRYADTLLKLLETNPSMELDTVMRRLDKLVGLEV